MLVKTLRSPWTNLCESNLLGSQHSLGPLSPGTRTRPGGFLAACGCVTRRASCLARLEVPVLHGNEREIDTTLTPPGNAIRKRHLGGRCEGSVGPRSVNYRSSLSVVPGRARCCSCTTAAHRPPSDHRRRRGRGASGSVRSAPRYGSSHARGPRRARRHQARRSQ